MNQVPEWVANKKQTAAFFGVSAQSIGDWMARGCPVDKQGNVLKFYLPDVVEWRAERMAGKIGSLEAERTRLAKQQADKTELENGKLRGELLPADDVFTVWSKFILDVRMRLLAMPSKLAPECVNLTSKAEAKDLIETEIHQALHDLTDIPIVTYLRKGAVTVQAADEIDGERVGRRRKKAVTGGKRGAGTVEN